MHFAGLLETDALRAVPALPALPAVLCFSLFWKKKDLLPWLPCCGEQSARHTTPRLPTGSTQPSDGRTQRFHACPTSGNKHFVSCVCCFTQQLPTMTHASC